MQHVVILGNGIAGVTAARTLRKLSEDRITIVSGETDYFFSRTALMYVFMGHMKFEHTKPYEDWFWKKNRLELRRGWVTTIDFGVRKLIFSDAAALEYDVLILALGSVTHKIGWPGQDLHGVQGLYSIQDLELMERSTKGVSRAVIAGGGLIGVEMAEMLHSRQIEVTFLVRERHYWENVLREEESLMIERHLREYGIDLRLETELSEIVGDDGQAVAIKTNRGETIPCQFVGLTTGVKPNVELVRTTSLEVREGILVDDLLQTNLPGVYAIGDCAELRDPQPNRRAIEPVWYTGRLMGEAVAHTVAGKLKPYRPGVWFNSAKFFDIEYQTYGYIPPETPLDAEVFYWEEASAKRSFTLMFDKNSRKALGVSLLGIRQRHDVWDRWITEEKTIDFVMQNLGQAAFDPEFTRSAERLIQRRFSGKREV